MACTSEYTVKPGDTLSRISASLFGSPFQSQALYDRNSAVIGPDANRLSVGQRLSYPCNGAWGGDVDWSVMPNPETVMAALEDERVQVLDIRKAKAVASGVLPNTISIPFANWRGPKDNPGEPLSGAAVAQLIGPAGLRLDQPIVIAHGRDRPMETGAAAVVYWHLKSVGAEQIAILRGGFKGWEAAGLPTVTQTAQATPYVTFLRFDDTWRADLQTVVEVGLRKRPGALLDARPHSMFDRLDNAGRSIASTLPGAYNLPAPSLLSLLKGEVDAADGVPEVREAFSALQMQGEDAPVITFCHVGELAALNWFYASELAGLPNIQLYPESLKGWRERGGPLFLGSLE